MNPSLQTSGYRGSDALVVERNRVLRNTYWLLALSMVPTVLGCVDRRIDRDRAVHVARHQPDRFSGRCVWADVRH